MNIENNEHMSEKDEKNETHEIEKLSGEIADLKNQIKAANSFVMSLGKGNIDVSPLENTNMLAGPLKELQSQISALTLGMKHLSEGKIVGKLFYSGDIFANFNTLIGKIANISRTNNGNGEINSQNHENHENNQINQISQIIQNSQINQNNQNNQNKNVNSWRYHQLMAAMNHLKIMVLEVSDNGTLLYANLPAKKYIGNIADFSQDIIDQRKDSEESEPAALLEYLVYFTNSQNKNITFPFFKEIQEKDSVWYRVTTEQVAFIDGAKGYMHVIEDISLWKMQENTLIHTAITDPLTKTYNRRAGMEALENIITFSEDSVYHCIAFADIDDLKVINDKFGHTEGDRAIKSIANVFLTSVRENDIVCRYGGDEFMIVFVKCRKPSAEKAFERMQDKINNLNNLNTGDLYQYSLSFSHGIVEISPSEIYNIENVINSVDKIMYENKKNKKNKKMANRQ